MKHARVLVALVALTAFGAARAETNPLSVTAQTDGSWSLSFTTSVLPKGWFTQSNEFDRTKTTLVAEVDALQASCSSALQSDARVSTADGSIVVGTVTNASGKNVVGYFWEYSGWDLTNLRNSYSLRYLCDGSVEVRGCDAARPIELTVSAFDKSGARTYTDDAGIQQPVTAMVGGLSLPAYHDAANDQRDECPTEPDCGIGTCQNACVQACAPGNDGKSCREGCECKCKIEVYDATGGVCHAKDKCLEP
jgi:hypothetical protein